MIVLDGWGVTLANSGNAIAQVETPHLDLYFNTFPHTTLEASGESVGLPHGESGSSEVGHMNLGSGRIVYQDLMRINTAIADGSFLKNKAFTEAVDHARKNKSNVHLLGLIGSGGVHSSIEHFYALLWFMKQQKVSNIYLHLFTDGRDSPPSSALQLFKELELKLEEIGLGEIVTISGRFFAMDRDKKWYKTEKAYNAMVNGEGLKASSVSQAIEQSYKKKIVDEFIEPTVIYGEGRTPKFVGNNDSVIFFNFRPDRARQLTKAFVQGNLNYFTRPSILENIYFVSMAEYERNLATHTAFPAPIINNPLSLIISTNNIQQLHVGETEKYAHVTYFFNGGIETPFPLEERVHIPSPRVTTFDLKPEMSAYPLTKYIIQKLKSPQYGFYVINFANADMVAHTGSLEATKRAVVVIDQCVGKIVSEVLPLGGTVVLVGDHGNAEQMINPLTKGVDTEHTSNPVPFLAISERLKGKNTQLQSGILADVAPSILYLMGLSQPIEMTGRNLFM